MLSLMVGLLLYLIGRIVEARGEKNEWKASPYACGENLPPLKFRVDVEKFFIYAIFFLIFDVLAFVLATSLSTISYFPAIYAFIALMSVTLLFPVWRRK
jgi:NADH:ubiquinone oxidoreductase subunit 3 (subunit A)